jgi:hypothetical protein
MSGNADTQERIGVLENRTEHVEVVLHKHVSECSAMQKRVLVIGCCTLGWLVAHSPEVGKAALRLVEVIAP